jgi:hypothetical protein
LYNYFYARIFVFRKKKKKLICKYFKIEIMRISRQNFLKGIVLTCLFAIAIQVNAQKLELTPFVGYETGAQAYTTSGYLRVADGMDYGGTLNFGMGGGRFLEFSYSHLSSTLSLDEPTNMRKLCDLAVDHYTLGALQEVMPGEKVTPYGLFTLGIANYRPTSDGYASENKMSINLAGGVKVWLSDKIGLRLQAKLIMPMFYSGTYFTVGTGGAGYSMAGGVMAVQGDFTGGLVIAIK